MSDKEEKEIEKEVLPSENKPDAKKISKKEVVKAFWRWTFFSHANYNYERLQATGVVYALSPILKHLYGNDEDAMKEALKRHMQFFNTEPHFGGAILGMTIAMEEEKSNGAPITNDTINGLKTGLMGPLAGIGDTLWQGTLIPILLSFTIGFASKGNILMGPILFAVLHLGIIWTIGYLSWMQGYSLGKEGIAKVLQGSLLPTVMTFAQCMGPIVIGALSATFVKVSSPLKIQLGKSVLKVQSGILDKLVLGLLPLGITLLAYYLLKRKFKPTTVVLILVVIGVVGGAFYII
ncbi:PTS system mannose/fructose/sorbose family transporter subunit IID [Loigolactobacillus backii]|uniref:PTS N-acetylglucosamine transporter subunit IIABC n=1 Tax=Loigolactobacillus backii TaxID=375175 RepID=A0A192H006_9LACO|nr:PTS system mannose/fructose/sorbose family transporter subunit IID [Loigolactobacillus backii]ANK62119.1 PTS N-acetylglucosamine transporter subunit IIABC [Loigolactobacillus backii]ANK68686.1 PTS N-acetylglucosamine transporter subunit IIABC [Loigolactobacillus backii]MDA5386689.1 PTS system mannose/fructose/sorbose family transporter subunit IID [Loigolactobacillus backii]MDA5389214.1 PTS system mannose/fructose/sorbose family transporter subunit IID [Loigolactobacillus backii]